MACLAFTFDPVNQSEAGIRTLQPFRSTQSVGAVMALQDFLLLMRTKSFNVFAIETQHYF